MTNNVNTITIFDATIDTTILTMLADHVTEGRQNPKVISLREIIAKILEVDIDSLSAKSTQAIVTNEAEMFGAINIYNSDCIEKVQEILGAENFYVLPSSIHEVICVPTEGIEIDDLLKMVTEVNQTQVRPEEQLGNFVLYYDGITRQLVKIAEK